MSYDEKAYQTAYYQANKEKIKARAKKWAVDNPERLKARCSAHYQANKAERKARSKLWEATNKERAKASAKAYRERPEVKAKLKAYLKENKKRYSTTRNEKEKKRKAADPLYRMKCNMKSRFSMAISNSGRAKAFSITGILSYPRETLRQHLESRFKPGMTWENYGKWHVDHIAPLDAFDLANPVEAKAAWALDNLQPLWASENCSKRNRILTQ